jgi:hypothetical protein
MAVNYKIPAIFREAEILVPCKVDVMLNGARYSDSFLWNIFGSVMSPDEFAAGIVRDLSLPVGFRSRIALQLCEQVEAYADLVCSVCALLPNDTNIEEHIPALCDMVLGLRHLSLEYSDSFSYDVINPAVTPEEFAIQTCADLGLAAEFEAAIALKMRDTIINSLTQWIETHAADEDTAISTSSNKRYRTNTTAAAPAAAAAAAAAASSNTEGGSDSGRAVVRIVPPALTAEMMQNMWKSNKPENVDVQASAALPTVPSENVSNSYIWQQPKQSAP